ncbi:PIN domain-containing protein [Garicola koreensis]|uniref:Putative nucleic acid-binding protein n=1 Tax=Garicola koreensis TaxID=1262554 RepID=A0A7W5TV02_9MICC|nr:PIN domain-containing protein [Garicola koreensis]MBB3667769.1 putative nucleic acid-binding protein [Garicola koreensis]
MAFPAFLDTCVLYGANLNDTLLRIAEEDAFSPQWSPDVVEELRRNLSMIPNLPAGAADRRVKAMTDAFPEAMVEGYEPLIPIMTCDPKDRHVLAAAVHSDSQVLVTFNLDDFPTSSLAGFEITAVHPDDFLLDQLDLHPEKVARSMIRQVDEATRPTLTMADLLQRLSRAGVPRFAAECQRRPFSSAT